MQGIFLYDTDVTVKGTGSLTADTSAVAGYGPAPFSVMAGKDTNPATRTGHFTQEGGNITVKANPKDPAICLSVSNDLTIRGGSLTTEGATYGMVCSKGTLSIEGGKVICRGFSGDGISNYKGDILISGQDTSVAVYTAEKDAYSFGIMAEPDPDSQLPSGNIMISGGNVHIEAGQVGIYTESGEVGIFGGTVYTKAENQTGSGDAVGIYSTGNLSVTGGEVFACGMGEGVSGVGLYSETALSVSGGAVTAQGTEQAVSPAPDFSSYPGAVVYAAADFEGTQPEEYQENNLAGYRYFSIHGPQFSLRFENGAAVITAPYSTDAEVLFAAYDQTGTLTALERKKAVLTPGENRILPELFQPEQGSTVKVMLWDSAGGMKPLCAAENGTV